MREIYDLINDNYNADNNYLQLEQKINPSGIRRKSINKRAALLFASIISACIVAAISLSFIFKKPKQTNGSVLLFDSQYSIRLNSNITNCLVTKDCSTDVELIFSISCWYEEFSNYSISFSRIIDGNKTIIETLYLDETKTDYLFVDEIKYDYFHKKEGYTALIFSIISSKTNGKQDIESVVQYTKTSTEIIIR